MKLITTAVLQEAHRRAVTSRAKEIEARVVKKLHNIAIQPKTEENLLYILENKNNTELTISSVVRNVQTVVNDAFKSKDDTPRYINNINKAIELLALSLVVAEEDLLEKESE